MVQSPNKPPEEQSYQSGQEDALTGFLNRVGATQRLSEIVDEIGINSLSVIAVEISRFGSMNDSIGADLGDKVISMTAKRLLKTFPDALMAARMHGDHFCLVFNAEEDIERAVTKLFDFAQRPLAIRGEVIVLSVRIGAADPRSEAKNATELLHAAEVALHRAKVQYNKISYFNAAMVDEARAQHRLENDLRVSLVKNAASLHSAIANEEFFLCYQPIISAASGQVHAFEALVRWKHPQKGIVSPALFIPMAEEIRVMDVLGAWILRRACADAMTWSATGNMPSPSVSVNVSPTQFDEPGLFEAALDNALNETGLAPSRLKLEITETAARGELLAQKLAEIRSRGCRISLDDFGTGYSSLTQLHALPLDYIKIDQSFVRGWETADATKAQQFERLTKSILALSDILELTPIVEGVESEDQVSRIIEWGGDLIQGYVYSKPMISDEVNTYLQRKQN